MVRRSFALPLAMVLGCGDSVASVSDEIDLCASALDPEIYVAPPWEPTPFVGTDDCPAVAGPAVVDLSSVTIGGVVTMQGQPTKVTGVRLVGRGNEGEVDIGFGYGDGVSDDGTFAARILPGHYDVWVGSALDALVDVRRLAFENVDLTASTELAIDIPALVTVSGSMTLDGEPARDSLGHIFIHEIGSGGALVSRMDRDTYAIHLAPGTYEFHYGACAPDWEFLPDVGINPCYDPDATRLSPPYASPQQTGVPIATNVGITQDMQLDLDVRTVRFSGSVAVAGVDDDELNIAIISEYGDGAVRPPRGFDIRAVVGTYQLRVDDRAPPVDDAFVLNRDTHRDILLDSFTMSVFADDQSAAVEVPYDRGGHVFVRALEGLMSSEGYLPVHGLRIFAGAHRVSVLTRYCWPDYSRDLPSVWRRIHDDLRVTGPLELEVITPELARVQLEYADLADPENPSIVLLPADEPHPVAHELSFTPGEPHFIAHGLVPAGRYSIRDEVVDIVDGTRLRIIETSQWVELRLVVDGVPSEWSSRLHLRRVSLPDSGGLVRPGRYEIGYNGKANEGMPQNHGATVGCITVPG